VSAAGRALCGIVGLFFVLLLSRAFADVEFEWRQILALDSGPRTEMQSAPEARRLTLQHLATQERALRDFLAKYPEDSRGVAAKLRLAHLLAVRSDFEGDASLYSQALKLLDALDKNPALDPARRADVAFARLSLQMRHVKNPLDSASREALLGKARVFQQQHPEDRRLGALFAEVARLFDAQPQKKEALLREAASLTTDSALKLQIDDDLKRIAMLGKPVELAAATAEGGRVDVQRFRGNVVLIYFFASWSAPAMLGLREIHALASDMSKEKFRVVGVSLDNDQEKLAAALKAEKINWPVAFDGKGWEGPLIRSLGINTLPTVWVLDRRGNLRALNAIDNTEGVIRALLREK
jgi:peroxiredoxin